MTKPKLRKNADISPPQSSHDGIHTCSRGCKKPGCTRTLRDTIEEQDKQIEALKRDVLEKTAELRKSEEHNEALCERMQDLNSELFACSCANANMHKYKNENARLKAEVERLIFDPLTYLDDKGEWMPRHTHLAAVERLKAEVERLTLLQAETLAERNKAEAQVERLTKAGDNLERILTGHISSYEVGNASHEWRAAKKGKLL
jgi:uncharacterized coiled-coil protein SlyX